MPRDQRPEDSELKATAEAVEPQSVFSKQLRRMVADLVLETTPEAIWLIDADARTTFVNRRLADMLGYRQEEMVGRYIFEFMDRERWPAAQRSLRLREQGVEGRREIELVRKDGSRVWLLGSGNAVFDREGRYAGALAVLGDLSEQKQRENALRGQIADLQARLAASQGTTGGSRPAEPAAERQTAAYREPFRTALVLGVLGTIFATVTVTTLGAVASSVLADDKQEEG
jgi:PAS domain S-box-containing protein